MRLATLFDGATEVSNSFRMINTIYQKLIVALSALCCTCAVFADDPICGTWQFWNNSVREMRPDGSSGLPGKPGDSKWSRLSPPGFKEPTYLIKNGDGKEIDKLALRNSGSLLFGVKGRKPFLSAKRISGGSLPINPPPTSVVKSNPSSPQKNTQPVVPKVPSTPQVPASSQGNREMVFSPDWMPTKMDISREFAKALRFYCTSALGSSNGGKETIPETIIWNLRWLMPMMEAEANVPGRERVQRDYEMQNPGFPQKSIHVRSLYGKFVDPISQEQFNICNLICDKRLQLISVQLVASNPKGMVWRQPTVPIVDPKAQPSSGVLEPYYDFIEVKINASTIQSVNYQISSATRGVTVIQTILDNEKRGALENVRWYLTSPLAVKLLEMVDTIAP
jgi:hypothetical protein